MAQPSDFAQLLVMFEKLICKRKAHCFTSTHYRLGNFAFFNKGKTTRNGQSIFFKKDNSIVSSILLMHHWRPCLKLRSAILIVLSTVAAKDANHRFQSKWWKKKVGLEAIGKLFPR